MSAEQKTIIYSANHCTSNFVNGKLEQQAPFTISQYENAKGKRIIRSTETSFEVVEENRMLQKWRKMVRTINNRKMKFSNILLDLFV